MLDPYAVLGLEPDRLTDEEVRVAYLDATRRHPPDRDPEAFQRVREAFDRIRTERDRLRLRLFGLPDDDSSVEEILPEGCVRRAAGAATWLAAIRTEAHRMQQSKARGTVRKDG